MLLADIPLIVPAAGKSSRMGSAKGLTLLDGRTWLDLQCESYERAGGRDVLLVLGYDRDAYVHALGIPGLPAVLMMRGCRLTVLLNPLPELGPFTSLQMACRRVVEHTEWPAAFYLPIDTPLPDAEILNRMLAALGPSTYAVEPRYNGSGGHPVLLSREFMCELLRLEAARPDARLDAQMKVLRGQGRVSAVPVEDERVVMNLNDAEAWQQYTADSNT